MAKITIIDDCMPFQKTIGVSYNGPDPFSISKKLWEDLKTYFQVSTSGVASTQLNWDDSGDPTTFFMRWWVTKKFGQYTGMRLKMKCNGAKKKADNTGSFSLTMSSRIETNYETSLPGPLAKLLWAVYSYIFYNKMRQQFLRQCQELTLSYREYLQKKFGMRTLPVERAYEYGLGTE